MNTTDSVFSAMQYDDRWLGFGYIGERRHQTDEAKVATADQQILDYAEAHGWDYNRLFTWANSKAGRWYADAAFGNDDLDLAMEWGELQ